MTFEKFYKILKTKYPQAEACPHGKFASTEKNNKVEINFTPCGKCYCYYGSYQTILNKIGINVVYQKDIAKAKKQLAQYINEHGKPNKYSLFFYDDNRNVMDYSKEIEEYKQYITDIENGKYIVVEEV